MGWGAAEGILGGLSDRYEVLNQPPPWGKDCNDYLMSVLARDRARAEHDKER